MEISTPKLSFRDKQEARSATKKYIKSISESYKIEAEQIVSNQLCKYILGNRPKPSLKIGLYRADSYELDLYPVLDKISDARFFFPVVNKSLVHLTWVEAESWVVGSYGILEPVGRSSINISEIDWVVVPGLGFGQMGHRLGRGKGYYDRALSGLKSEKILGTCLDYCKNMDFPWENHDLRIGSLFTEKGRFSFLD